MTENSHTRLTALVSSYPLFFFLKKIPFNLKKGNKNISPICLHLSSHFRQSTHNARICFLHHELLVLGVDFYMYEIICYLFFWPLYFPSHNVLKVYLYVTNGRSFIPLYPFSSATSSCVRLFAIRWTAARQDSTAWLSNIPLCIYITFCLSFKLSLDIYIASISWLL